MIDHPQPSSPPDPSSPDRQAAQLARLEALLLHGEISNLHGVMRWGSNYAALVTITDDELQATAVYKPQRGERPLWDFPDGTLCYREVIAYVISKHLGWYLVPPTVLRDGPHGIGSFQLFIDHNPEINYFALDDQYIEQLRQYAIFDYLVNNADRKGGHLLLAADGKLWGIDHGLTFNTIPKLRTVIWDFAGDCIPEHLLEPVGTLLKQLEVADSPLRCQINPLLSSAEITALIRRTRHLLERKTFPQPGPGPNYPWPPV